MPNARSLLTDAEERLLVEYIKDKESRTSGEIRVHIEDYCEGNPLERTISVFRYLNMHKTRDRNGILIYLSARDHRLAIWGDEGIDAKVEQRFWEEIVAITASDFKAKEYLLGLKAAIKLVGIKLAEEFPRKNDDTNELPNEISYGPE